MKHLSEEDLVLRYYGEPSGGAAVDEHLQTCEVAARIWFQCRACSTPWTPGSNEP